MHILSKPNIINFKMCDLLNNNFRLTAQFSLVNMEHTYITISLWSCLSPTSHVNSQSKLWYNCRKTPIVFKILALLLDFPHDTFSYLSSTSQGHFCSSASACSGRGPLHNHQPRKWPIGLPTDDSSQKTLACIKTIKIQVANTESVWCSDI